MRRIWIDFKQPAPALLRHLPGVLLAAGALALGLSILQQQQSSARKASLAWQQQNLARMESRGLPALRIATDTAADQEAARRANDVLHRLNLPWDRLFGALEQSVTQDVSILSVAPDPGKSTISLKALVKDTDVAIDLMERLQATGQLSDIHLVSQETVDENRRYPLQVTLNAGWRISP